MDADAVVTRPEEESPQAERERREASKRQQNPGTTLESRKTKLINEFLPAKTGWKVQDLDIR